MSVHLFSIKLDVTRDVASVNDKNSTEECAIRNERMKPKFRWNDINQVDESANQGNNREIYEIEAV